MQKWESIESALSKFCSLEQKTACIKKIRIVTAITLIMALSELIPSFVKSMLINRCFSSMFYAVDQLIFIGTNIQFIQTAQNETSVWVAQCFNLSIVIIRLFMWNFLHVFIMVLSVGLSTHFKLINDELEKAILLCEPIVHSHLIGVNSILEVNFNSCSDSESFLTLCFS